MGFWKSFFGLESRVEEIDDTQSGKDSNVDTTFVTRDEESDFVSSMFGQLELLGADLSYIEEVLPEKGENLRKQIVLLRQLLLQTNNEDDLEVQQVFKDLTTQFEEDRRLADGEYTLRQLEQQNRSMDKIFEVSLKGDGITKAKLDEYLEYIKKIQDKVSETDNSITPLLENVKRQKFNEISMRAEYRIKMLELMYLLNIGEVDVNPFRNLSSSKQKMFSKYFWEDATIASQQYDSLSYHEDMFNATIPYYFSSIDSIAKRLNSQLEDASMIEDFSIKQLFDSKNPSSESFSFLKDFISFKTTMNEMRERKDELQSSYQKKLEDDARRKAEQDEAEIRKQLQDQEATQKQEAEKEAKKQRLESFKNMTADEINAEIYRIEHDLKATGSRFVNILDFQKEVASARGLLDSEQEVQSDELIYKRVDAVTAWTFVQNANELGVNYTIFPDSQEFGKGGFLIAVSKTDKKVLEIEEKSAPFESKRNSYYSYVTDANYGSFPVSVLDLLNAYLKEAKDGENYYESLSATKNSRGLYDLSYVHKTNNYRTSSDEIKEKKVYDKLLEIRDGRRLSEIGSNPKELKDVMCYISFPATRNIIPILEEFKNAQVTPFFEPLPDSKRNSKSRDNIHIYFRREDLEKFNSTVLSQISNSNVGIVNLRWDTTSFGDAIKEVSKWPEAKEFESK